MSDEFTGDSGLKDDYDGVIVESEFEQSERGNWQLHIKVAADDGDEVEYRYSVGGKDKGWTSYDGGETIQGATPKSKFHDNSGYQQFIYKVMDTEAADELRERSASLYERRGPFHAALWMGLRFHWDVVTEKGRRANEAGDWEERDVQVSRPTKFLGVTSLEGGQPKPAKSNITPMPTQAQTPSTNGAVEISEGDLKILTRLAVTNDTHEAFVDAVMEASGANGESFLKNKPVMKAVGKKDWYESVRS